MTLCLCGCTLPVLSPRARYASARCRLKASQARNSPVLTKEQRRTIRRAEYWLRDYRQFLLPVIREGGMDQATTDALKAQCETLTALATELNRLARGAGQLPLRMRQEMR